jgi:hypothetical protein
MIPNHTDQSSIQQAQYPKNLSKDSTIKMKMKMKMKMKREGPSLATSTSPRFPKTPNWFVCVLWQQIPNGGAPKPKNFIRTMYEYLMLLGEGAVTRTHTHSTH